MVTENKEAAMRGAGGTEGGFGTFFLGLMMMCGGFYLLFNSIIVNAHFGVGVRLYGVGNFGITSGMIMIPFLIGVGLLFYNSANIVGWVLSLGSLVALMFGALSLINFSFRTMSAFDLIVILVLSFGGLGLFLRSLRAHSRPTER
ncbi:MAG: hypothetical protein ACI8W7_000430 [Gammaproteobacteria bacterium]